MADKYVTKDYIERFYDIAILDYKTAHTQEDLWNARKDMARLEALASTVFGFDYADQLEQRKRGLYNGKI